MICRKTLLLPLLPISPFSYIQHLSSSLIDLVETVSKQALPDHVKDITFELAVNDSSGEDVEVSSNLRAKPIFLDGVLTLILSGLSQQGTITESKGSLISPNRLCSELFQLFPANSLVLLKLKFYMEFSTFVNTDS